MNKTNEILPSAIDPDAPNPWLPTPDPPPPPPARTVGSGKGLLGWLGNGGSRKRHESRFTEKGNSMELKVSEVDIDAAYVSNLAKQYDQDQLNTILTRIVEHAKDRCLHVYSPLSPSTLKALEKKGFLITRHGSEKEKDIVQYTIRWR
jgi:hypothetical protein